jgi:hypothetical protein
LWSFLVVHELGTWFFAEEYVVPVIPIVIVLSVSILVSYGNELAATTRRAPQTFKRRAETSKTLDPRYVTCALIVCIGLTAFTGGHRGYIGTPGWNGAPAAGGALARCVQTNSTSHDRVLGLFFADLVTEAHRLPLDRAAMGVFSYEDLSPQRANDLHMLDESALLDLLKHRPPKVVVLSSVDRDTLNFGGVFSSRQVDGSEYTNAINSNYRQACSGSLTRQIPNSKLKVQVFVRRSP